MNQYNDVASLALSCNTNVSSADRAAFSYMTLYSTKQNQTEEKLAYLAVYEGLSRRIDYQSSLLAQHLETHK